MLPDGASPATIHRAVRDQFQWAPTLGGECYDCSMVLTEPFSDSACFNGHPPLGVNATSGDAEASTSASARGTFQWAPTLGGECYSLRRLVVYGFSGLLAGFNGHPPLGVNATIWSSTGRVVSFAAGFQWAPTLGGECYGIVYLITPPLCQGVNALLNISKRL